METCSVVQPLSWHQHEAVIFTEGCQGHYRWLHQRMQRGNKEHQPLALYDVDVCLYQVCRTMKFCELLDQNILYIGRF